MLISLGRLDEAESELRTQHQPQTRDDWRRFHLLGILKVRSGRGEEALDHFRYGVENTPFIRLRRAFENGRVLVLLAGERYGEALKELPRPNHFEAGEISNVLQFHAAAGARANVASELYHELGQERSATIIELRDEIAARFGVIDRPTTRTEDWISEREIEAVMLEAA